MPDLVPVSGLDPDPAASARFELWAEMLALVADHDLGGDHDAWSVEELRGLEGSTTKRRLQVLAVADGAPVGAAGLILPLRDNERTASIFVAAHPEHRRRGVGRALLGWAEECARAEGRTVAFAQTQWVGGSDGDAHASWAMTHGYAAAQTILRSDLEVAGLPPTDPIVLEGYRLETHVDEMPEADLADRAVLARRMSTDAPLGDLELGEEEWDEERVRGEDERTRAMRRRIVATFARHLSSGRLVGFTTVEVPQDAPALAYQQDTLVLREHRGHALGLALKQANHRALAGALPGVRTVRTWNAVENAHMLAVNTALGFRPSGYSTEWQKHLH